MAITQLHTQWVSSHEFQSYRSSRSSPKVGQHSWAPAGVDGPTLPGAMSGNESSFGLNCLPRHEPAYCTGIDSHNPEVAKLTQDYGHGAHCSYGAMADSARELPRGNVAAEHGVAFDRAALETVSFMNRHVLKAQGASSVEEIAAAWNSGSPHHPNGLPPGGEHVEQMRDYYDHEPMPQPVQAPELSLNH